MKRNEYLSAVQTISFIFSIPFKRISPYIRLAVSCKGLMILATKKDSLLKLSDCLIGPSMHCIPLQKYGHTSLFTLIIFMAIDYISGLIVAGVFHNSEKTENGALESNAFSIILMVSFTTKPITTASRIKLESIIISNRQATNTINKVTPFLHNPFQPSLLSKAPFSVDHDEMLLDLALGQEEIKLNQELAMGGEM